jgi:hypothetical protein
VEKGRAQPSILQRPKAWIRRKQALEEVLADHHHYRQLTVTRPPVHEFEQDLPKPDVVVKKRWP